MSDTAQDNRMDDNSRIVLRTVIGAAILSVAGNAFQTYTQLQVMEEKLIGIQQSQDLKIEALTREDGHLAQRIRTTEDRLGGLEKMFYEHTTADRKHRVAP